MSEFQVKIIADSISAADKRLTTITATYPRFIHAEILTHRDRARNSASSRAIPWPKMMAAINENPVIPIRFGSEQKGMQTGGDIDRPDLAETVWLEARDYAVKAAQQLANLGVHKSICNRLTEPWMWITVVMTATEWNNFFRLRCHPDAEIHFQKIAGMIREAMKLSVPARKNFGEWHLPFTVPEDFDHPIDQVCRVSVARCARVSYLTHEGKRDFDKDLELFERLVQGSGFGHWSAHEHVAMAEFPDRRSGPFVGWIQYRKSFANENLAG
jgi:hypothetical protein